MNLHVAFTVDAKDLVEAPARPEISRESCRAISGNPTDEPVVLAWMPALSLYFQDPDGHSLEYMAMLTDDPQPERGVRPSGEVNARKLSKPSEPHARLRFRVK